MYIVIICFPISDVMSFSVNLKQLNVLRTKRALKVK